VVTDREAAWDELLDATPAGWYVGEPSYHNERREWVLYALIPPSGPSPATVSASGRPSPTRS